MALPASRTNILLCWSGSRRPAGASRPMATSWCSGSGLRRRRRSDWRKRWQSRPGSIPAAEGQDFEKAKAVKLLRTIALDPSDTFVFDVAAEPGEWAVSGAFRFYDRDPAALAGKDRAAFRGGFLGVQSWGWSTLVQIVPATEADRSALVELLAGKLV